MPFNDRILLKMRRDMLPKDGFGAGLDAGGSLTKVAYIRKADEGDSEHAVIELNYFHNSEFAKAIQYVHDNGALNGGKPDSWLPATGATTTKNHDVIQKILGVSEVATFNEFNCHVQGMSFLVKNFPDDDFCDSEENYKGAELSSQVSDLSLCNELREARKETYHFRDEWKIVNDFAEDEHHRFPFLMIMAGSGNGNFIIDANNDMVMITGTFKAGKSLLGLTGTMFDIPKNHYVELCAMAEHGEIQSKSKCSGEKQDLYDRLNSQVECEFPFTHTEGKKENLALALVRDFAEEQAYTIALAISRTNVKNVYYGGGMALSNVMRQEIAAAVRRYKLKDVKLRFVKTNCTAALGALVRQRELQEEAAKLAEVMKMMAAAAAAQAQAQAQAPASQAATA